MSGVSFSGIKLAGTAAGQLTGTAITVDEFDGNIPGNASRTPDGWPTITNVFFSNITGGAITAGVFHCIPERPCTGVHLRSTFNGVGGMLVPP